MTAVTPAVLEIPKEQQKRDDAHGRKIIVEQKRRRPGFGDLDTEAVKPVKFT